MIKPNGNLTNQYVGDGVSVDVAAPAFVVPSAVTTIYNGDIRVTVLHVANTTASPVTFLAEDGNNMPIIPTISLAGNTAQTFYFGERGLLFSKGIKVQAGTASALAMSVAGTMF